MNRRAQATLETTLVLAALFAVCIGIVALENGLRETEANLRARTTAREHATRCCAILNDAIAADVRNVPLPVECAIRQSSVLDGTTDACPLLSERASITAKKTIEIRPPE